MIIILGFVCALIYWLVVDSIKRREYNAKFKHFPSTNLSYPILGDIRVWSIMKWSLPEKMKNFIEVVRDYPTTLKVWFGTKVVLIINNPEDIETILSSPHCINKSSLYHATIGGDGLFVANGDKWRNQRRNLNSAFSTRMLKSYQNQFNEFGRNMVAALKTNARSENKFDITPIIGNYVTDLITRTIYGSTKHKIETTKQCYELIEHLMVFWADRMMQIYLNFFLVWIRKIFKIESIDKNLNKELRITLYPLFKHKEEEYKKKLNTGNGNDVKDEDFLEKLIRLQFEDSISLSEYRHTSMTMLLAGSETSSRSISIIILMLALHEEYQQKIYDEINNIIGIDDQNDIDISKLSEFILMDRFIKETFRIFPVATFIGRKPSHDIAIKEGIIPAGTDILISVINIHQHSQIWGKDAKKFNPDNFLPEAVAGRNKCSYIPFSYGSRNCIGYKFAHVSIYTAIIYLLKNYRFKTTIKMEDVNFGYSLITYSKNNNLVSIQPRNSYSK